MMPTRRTWLVGGAAAAAAVAGAGVAAWRLRADAGDEAGASQIWSMQFETIGGPPLALAPLRGKPTLLNFWATWCAPCISELPLIDRFQREHQAAGWQVVGLAVDRIGPVTEFLAKRPVGFAIGLAGFEGVELSQRMGNRGGALPFSVVFDRRGGVIERKLGIIKPEDLQRWAAAAG